MATLLDGVANHSAGLVAWTTGRVRGGETDVIDSGAAPTSGRFSVEIRSKRAALDKTSSSTADGYVVSVNRVTSPSAQQANESAAAQRNVLQGVVGYFDDDTVMTTLVGLREEPRFALPRGLFPESLTEGGTFTIEMAVSGDGFRTPVVRMVEIPPTQAVSAIHDEIRGLLENF